MSRYTAVELSGAERTRAPAEERAQIATWGLTMPNVEPSPPDFGRGRFRAVGETEIGVANDEEHWYCGKFLLQRGRRPFAAGHGAHLLGPPYFGIPPVCGTRTPCCCRCLPRATCGYQLRESSTATHCPPSAMDCWLARPGRVMSIASWMPIGGVAPVAMASTKSWISQ